MSFSGWRLTYAGLVYGLVIATFVWLLGWLGAFGFINGWAYDAFVRSQQGQISARQILLIEADSAQAQSGDNVWGNLLDILEKKGARQIAFSFSPGGTSSTFYKQAKSYGNVIFGQKLIADPTNPDAIMLEPVPLAAEGIKVSYGVVAVPPDDYGVYRSQYLNYEIDGKPYPSVETITAQAVLGHPVSVTSPTYLVNFEMGSDRLPKVSLDRVLKGGLVDEMIKDRSVLIGFKRGSDTPGLRTPVTSADIRMSILEYRGAALYSLLTKRTVTEPNLIVQLAILLALVAASLLAFQWLNIRQSTWLSLVMFVAYVAAAWLLLANARVWIPLAEMTITQLAFFVLFFRKRAIIEDQALHRMILNLSAKLEERLFPASFYDSQEHWSQAANMVNQMLHLNRLIFLERVPGDHRVREVKALYCTVEDIDEMRRDYERTPYSTAIKENGPIHIESKRVYLKNPAENERQYIAPLVFGGDVLGFWVFGVDAEAVNLNPEFTQTVKDFSNQIAELLYHRQRWAARKEEELDSYRDIFGVEGKDVPCKQLGKSIELLDRRLTNLEDVMNGMGTATILYDLFGNVVQVNRHMEELAKSMGFVPYEMTALDFMTAVSGVDTQKARGYFQHIVLEHGGMSLPVKKLPDSDRSFILNVRALVQQEGTVDPLATGEAHPFEMHGILYELVDISEMKSLYQLKERLAERLVFQFRNDLQSIIAASSLLTHTEITHKQREHAEDIIQAKVDHMEGVFEESHNYMAVDIEEEVAGVFPVDAKMPLDFAIHSLEQQSLERKVTIGSHASEFLRLVLASPHGLTAVLRSFLTLLLNDAIENSEIDIQIETQQGEIIYLMKNSGFGIPNERLQECLYGNEAFSSEEFKDVRESVLKIRSWGGSLNAISEVGEGMRIEMRLKSLI